MSELDPHTRLTLNAAMLAYPTPDQRATALAMTSIAGSIAGFAGLMVLAWRERPVPRRRGRG